MYKLFATLLTVSALVFAQAKGNEPPPAQPGDALKVIELKNASPARVARELNAVLGGLAAVQETSKGLIVRGSPEALTLIEAAAARLDVPAAVNPPVVLKNVELTVHVLYASAMDRPGDKIPAELESTVRQLRASFSYPSYRVMDTIILRTRERNNVEQTATLPGTTLRVFVRTNVEVTQGTAPQTLRLNGLRITVHGNDSTGAAVDMEIVTNLDAREGQRTVVGKANFANSNDAIFVVVTPKIVD